MTPEQKDEIAAILETVARNGLSIPRDLDWALDAIERVMQQGDLIHRLEATRLWWMIGRGQVRVGEPPFGCVLQEPRISGRMVGKTEGDSLDDCVERAIAQVRAIPHDERPTDPHHGGKVSP